MGVRILVGQFSSSQARVSERKSLSSAMFGILLCVSQVFSFVEFPILLAREVFQDPAAFA